MKKMKVQSLGAVHTHTHTHTRNLKNKKKNETAITLIALVITIVILLVLAGIVISSLGGENGLLTRVKQAKQAQIQADMKEKLTLSIQDLQVEKLGDATLDDITQEWIDTKINDYTCTVKNDLSISGKRVIMEKNGIICKFLIDEKLNITQIEESSGATLEYEVTSRDGDNVHALVTVKDKENGLKQVEYQDGTILYFNGEDEWAKDCLITLGVEYKVKITSKDGQVKEETILINDYYHKITKNLGEGISIDNTAVKAAYNKPYQATITAGNEYKINTIVVTMGGQEVTVDTLTGMISIEKVIGDIVINATATKIEIQTTSPYIGTSTTETNSANSVANNSQTRGTPLYINFVATLEGTNCTIEPELPYSVTGNGKYKFIAKGLYKDKEITKEIEVAVNKYKSAAYLVEYDAGEWTQDEIKDLQTSKLYDINANHEANGTFRLTSSNNSGLNFTFGGFTYAKDSSGNTNPDASIAGVITSRNQSVSPQSGFGTPQYDGWQILEIKDGEGNIIKSETQIDEKISTRGENKIYVTKLMHAGSPENFVFYYSYKNDAYRAEYLMSSGLRQTNYSILNDGKTEINPRNWDMYRDKELEQKNYIKNVHCLTVEEAFDIVGHDDKTSGMRTTGGNYWLATACDYYSANWNTTWNGSKNFGRVDALGDIYNGYNNHCFGIRPVVEMNDGVFIASGDGTEASPYILGKE